MSTQAVRDPVDELACMTARVASRSVSSSRFDQPSLLIATTKAITLRGGTSIGASASVPPRSSPSTSAEQGLGAPEDDAAAQVARYVCLLSNPPSAWSARVCIPSSCADGVRPSLSVRIAAPRVFAAAHHTWHSPCTRVWRIANGRRNAPPVEVSGGRMLN